MARVIAAFAGAYGVGYLGVIAWVMPEVLRGDYFNHVVRFGPLADRGEVGELIGFAFAYQSGHTIAVSKTIAILNYVLLDYSLAFSKYFAVFLIAAFALTYGRLVWGRLDRTWASALVLLVGTFLILNPVHYGVYIWSDAVHAHYLFLIFGFAAIFLLARLLEQGGPIATKSVLLAGTTGLAILSNGAGVSVLPALGLLWLLARRENAAAFVGGRRPIWYLGAGAILMVSLAVLAAVLYRFARANERAFHLDTSLRTFGQVLEEPGLFLGYALALPYAPVAQAPFPLVSLLGGALVAWFLVLLMGSWRSSASVPMRPWLAVSFFGLCNALLVAAFRFSYDLQHGDGPSNRYAIYALPFLLGLVPATRLAVGVGLFDGFLRRGGPVRRRGFLALAGGFGVATLLLGALGFATHHRNSIGEARLMAMAQRGMINWSMKAAERLTSSPGKLGRYYLEDLPRLKALGKVPAVTGSFIGDPAGFAHREGIALPLRRSALNANVSRICDASGDARVVYVGRDNRYPFRENPPRVDFVRVIGHARNPRDCSGQVDFVFATDSAGQVLCVSRTMVHPWWDLPKAVREIYRGSPHAFDFSCPVQKGIEAHAPFAIYSFVREEGRATMLTQPVSAARP